MFARPKLRNSTHLIIRKDGNCRVIRTAIYSCWMKHAVSVAGTWEVCTYDEEGSDNDLEVSAIWGTRPIICTHRAQLQYERRNTLIERAKNVDSLQSLRRHRQPKIYFGKPAWSQADGCPESGDRSQLSGSGSSASRCAHCAWSVYNCYLMASDWPTPERAACVHASNLISWLEKLYLTQAN